MLRTPRAGKGPGGCGGWGLGSRNRRGPGMPPPAPPSQRAGDVTWDPSRLPGLQWVGQMPSSPLLLLRSGRAPPACLSWSPWPPSYAPRTHVAWRGLGRQGISLGARQAPHAWVGQAIALRSSLAPPRGPLLPASSDLPGLRGTDPVWPPFLLPPQSPYVLPVHFGFPPVSLGVRAPLQRLAGALVWGDANSVSSHTAIFSLPVLTKGLPTSPSKAFQFQEQNNLAHKPQTNQKFVFLSNWEGMRT